MLQAFALGAIAQSSLLLSGVIPYVMRIPDRIVGVLAGIGAGALIAAVAFDLTPEALNIREAAVWFLVGGGIFLLADHLIEQRFGANGAGAAFGIVLGSVVDGVPESLIFGIQLGAGVQISAAFLAAVFVSNIPQALAPSADLKELGWPVRRMVTLWGTVVIACAVASGLGFLIASGFADLVGARAAAIAAGGLLAMLAASLVPFAFEKGGAWAALATVVGFCASMSQT